MVRYGLAIFLRGQIWSRCNPFFAIATGHSVLIDGLRGMFTKAVRGGAR